jgi:hypothetical protein
LQRCALTRHLRDASRARPALLGSSRTSITSAEADSREFDLFEEALALRVVHR